MSRILIVIPCLNEAKHIGALLEKFMPYAVASGALIVVADGGSTDGTIDIVKEVAVASEQVHLLHNPARLQSAAVNLAVEQYGDEAEWLIRIDAHADYPHDYCQVLLAEAELYCADSVVVSMYAKGQRLIQSLAAATQNSPLGNGGSAHRNVTQGKWVDHGHHALMKIRAFRSVGGYDESFSHNEDAELDLRLTRAGYRIWLTDGTGLIYYPRTSLTALARQYFNYGKGRASTLLKHRMRPKPRQRLIIGVAPMMLLAPLGAVSWVFAVPILIWFLACLLGGMLLAFKSRRLFNILTGPIAALMHLAWSAGFWSAIARAPTQQRKPVPI